MDGSAHASVLRRKLATPAPEAPRAGPVSPLARAIKLALPRASNRLIKLDIEVAQVTLRTCDLFEMLETLPEGGLFAVLDGPDERQALFVLDPLALASVIEKQMTGKLAAVPPQPRRPTRTDAALCADTVDITMREFEEILEDHGGIEGVQGYGYANYFTETRPLAMLLDDCTYSILDLDLQIQGRTAKAFLALPDVRVSSPTKPVVGDEPARGKPDLDWTQALHSAVVDGSVSFETVLHRFRLPWSEAAGMVVGQEIRLPVSAIGATRLITREGEDIATGRLGQRGGFRALLLCSPEEWEQRKDTEATEGFNAAAPGLAPTQPTVAPPVTAAPVPAPPPAAPSAKVTPPNVPSAPVEAQAPPAAVLPPLADLDSVSELPEFADLPELGDLPDLPDI